MSDSASRFFNWAIVAVGFLIAAFAGPCTLFFGGGALVELARGDAEGQLAGAILLTALVFGGIPLAGGIAMVLSGLRSLRRRPPSG